MSERINDLLKGVSEDMLSDKCFVLSDEWAEENNVSDEEKLELRELISTVINGYAYSSVNVKMAVLLSGMECFAVNPNIVPDKMKLRRLSKKFISGGMEP